MSSKLERQRRVRAQQTGILTRTTRIWLDPAGFVHVEALGQGIVQDEQDMMATREVVHTLMPEQPGCLLVDMRGFRYVTREARRAVSSVDRERSLVALAFLIANPLSRLLASAFIGLGDLPYPARTFTDLDEARAWLVEQAEGP